MAVDLPSLAIVGAGRHARTFHYPSLRHLARIGKCSIAAVCDLDVEAAVQAAATVGAPAVYQDFLEMARRAKPDGIVVITPLSATAHVAGSLLCRGYPVLMEKPPGRNTKECRALIRAAQAGRAPGVVAFNRRFCPALQLARTAVLARGACLGASAQMYRSGRKDEDFFFGTGIHALDALRWLGGELERVECDRRTLARGERPAFTLFLGYRSGGAGTLSVRPQAGALVERYELYGERCIAWAHAIDGPLGGPEEAVRLVESNRSVRLDPPMKPYRSLRGPVRAAAAGGIYGEDAAFVRALTGKGKFSPTLEEVLPSVEIAQAVQAGRGWKRGRA